LTQLYERLKLEKRNLEIQMEGKENLLQQTRGEERIFAIMLEESKKQQALIQTDIMVLREALQFIQLKMEEMGDDFDPTEFRSLFSGEKISIYEFINATRDAVDIDFIWPVSASRGISAYFRDASYAAVFGVRHNAIDVRLPQETIIRAPADGVVYKVRDNGFGYSYLMIAHQGGFVTVYGHITQFMVEPGEKIYKGQAVALSGGIPGTKGAGLMTTGAHLHFEIMKDGNYVDPLLYLPLSALPAGSIPEKYTALVAPEPPGGLLTVY
jgi:murein DD-endopeptidase MepM/ murein hydrolase activator NlpD